MIRKETTAFGVNAKDDKIRYESSSGGMFSLLAMEVLSIGGVICGAALSDDCRTLTHVIINNLDELAKIRKSKYFQSRIGDIYGKILDILNTGKMVLFSGTPCQVAGLKKFLRKDYSNLITIEVICHGVPSSKLWRKYLDWIEKKYGKNVKSVNFRSKKDSWERFGMVEKLDDEEYIYNHHRDNPYFALFLSNCCLRPSCYSCQTKKIADISLGDLWGIEEIAPDLDDGKGTSLVLINSEKGKRIWEKVKSKTVFQEILYERAVENNVCIERSVLKPALRDTFFGDMNRMQFGQLAFMYRYPTLKLRVKHIIKIVFMRKLGGR